MTFKTLDFVLTIMSTLAAEAEAAAPWWKEDLRSLDLGESKVEFDETHYPNGLNHDFIREDVSKHDRLAQYIGAEGKFESPEKRDIAANIEPIISMLKTSANLTKESVVADVGAGTGLLLKRFSEEAKEVVALEISSDFRLYLQERIHTEELSNVEVRESTLVGLDLTAGSADLAVMVDVYHHLEYVNYARAMLYV